MLVGLQVPSAYAKTQDQARIDAANLRQWISNRIYSERFPNSAGAIASTDSDHPLAYRADETPMTVVSSYFAHYAVLALLDTSVPGTPEHDEALELTANWIKWYFNHLRAPFNTEGPVYDVWYTYAGTGEAVTLREKLVINNVVSYVDHPAHVDAVDSGAAMFFVVLQRYAQERRHLSILTDQGNAQKVINLAKALMSLRRQSGLWCASNSYSSEYLMDNCEVWQGLNALAKLYSNVYTKTPETPDYSLAATDLKSKILEELWVVKEGHWLVARGEKYIPGDWYTGMMCQFWPVVTGLIAPTDKRAVAVSKTLSTNWMHGEKSDWVNNPWSVYKDAFINSSAAWFSILSGNKHNAGEWLQSIHKTNIKVLNGSGKFNAILGLSEASWLLKVLSELSKR